MVERGAAAASATVASAFVVAVVVAVSRRPAEIRSQTLE